MKGSAPTCFEDTQHFTIRNEKDATMTDEIWEHYAREYQAVQSRAWQPIRSGVPYTCQTCPALIELQAELERWKTVAERLACADWKDEAAMLFAYSAYEDLIRAVQP